MGKRGDIAPVDLVFQQGPEIIVSVFLHHIGDTDAGELAANDRLPLEFQFQGDGALLIQLHIVMGGNGQRHSSKQQ